VYPPAASVRSSPRTLGPLAFAMVVPFCASARLRDEHFENDSLAFTAPAPTVTAKLRLGDFELRDPENVWVTGGVGGALWTMGLGDELMVVEPPELVAVTATRSVASTSAEASA
jgi:hypothetical protein